MGKIQKLLFGKKLQNLLLGKKIILQKLLFGKNNFTKTFIWKKSLCSSDEVGRGDQVHLIIIRRRRRIIRRRIRRRIVTKFEFGPKIPVTDPSYLADAYCLEYHEISSLGIKTF